MALDRRSFLGTLAVPGVVGVKPLLAGADDPKTDAAVFAEARRHFLIPEGVAYCNTGTLGASPRQVVDALANGTRWLESELAAWPYFQADGEPLTGYQPLVELRTAAAKLLGVNVDELAITQNATMGMSFVANGLDLAAGDEVLSTDHEHVGGITCWRLRAKRHGVVVKELSLSPALAGGPEAIVKLFADAITPKTRVLSFSHITSGLGILLPARELCALARERGIFSVVDGAQAVGQIPVNVAALGCDAYAASPHKWLMAPKGTGLLYVRRQSQERVWTTLASTAWDDREKGAFRFMQYGTGAVPVADGLRAALLFVEGLGIERIARWDATLTKRLRDGLLRIPKARLSSPADPRLSTAITTFRIEGQTARALQDALWAKQVRVRAQSDERGVRLSAHLYVSPADIDRALEAAAAL